MLGITTILAVLLGSGPDPAQLVEAFAGESEAQSAQSEGSRSLRSFNESACAGDARALIARALGIDVDNVQLDDLERAGGGPACWSRFEYKSDSGWPYGRGVATWTPSASAVEWLTTVDGDEPLHSISWRDFNGDRVEDLYFLSGEEEVLRTWIFVAAASSEPVLAYSHPNEYASVLDVDGDGRPEVMDSGADGSLSCMDCEDECALPAQYTSTVADEYRRLTGDFGNINYTFGFPLETRAQFSLFLFEPMRIFQIEGTSVRETTGSHGQHLQWRLELLRQLRGTSGPDCDERILKLSSYFEELLQARPSTSSSCCSGETESN